LIDNKRVSRPVRLIFVLAIVIVANALALPAVTQIWSPPGSWGLELSSNWVVAAIDPGGAAAQAGVHPGDRIDASVLSLADRLALAASVGDAGFVSPPGRRITTRLIRDRIVHPATLISLPQPLSFALVSDVILNRLTALVFTIVGAVLFFLKPSRMTGAFFAFAVGTTAGSPLGLTSLPAAVYLAGEVATDIVTIVGIVGFLVFMLRFPNDTVAGWRRALDKGAPFILVALALFAALIDLKFFVRGEGVGSLPSLFGAMTTVVTTIGVVALLSTYVQLRGEGRQRIKWVAAALVVYYAADLAIRHFPVSYNYGLRVLYLCVPFSVAYAVLRHRVIDVNFFISRALVYGIMTSVIAAIFTLLDFFFVRILDAGKIGLAVEIIVALSVGFWLNGLHRELDPVIDRLFFRQRYLGERRLARAALALPHAETISTIDDYLVREPLDAFELTSAALFTRADDGQFVREASLGWPDETARTLSHDDRIALSLAAEHMPLRVKEVHWLRNDILSGTFAPVLAVPVLVRRRLKAIALYGSHANGADLDIDEIQSLNALAQSASAAYDHLEAVTLRQQVSEQRKEIELLRSAAVQS
jgi:hypothetical protein